jgi:hypothetical protein
MASGTGKKSGPRARPARTIFVLQEPGVATLALRVTLVWMVIVVFMATADALSPQTFIRISAWLSLFFLGVVVSFWALLSAKRAAAATGALTGVFLGPYSLTWELWVIYALHWRGFFPVVLYPFPLSLNEGDWYVMMAVGFALCIVSFAALIRFSRPGPAFIRVHHDTGEAHRLGDPP